MERRMIKLKWSGAELEQWAKEAEAETKDYVFEFLQELNAEMVQATPVDTGFLRNSWHGGVNHEPHGGAGTGGIASLDAAAAEVQLGDIFYGVNTAEYAMRLEYGFMGVDRFGRHYHQLPRAFVRRTLER